MNPIFPCDRGAATHSCIMHDPGRGTLCKNAPRTSPVYRPKRTDVRLSSQTMTLWSRQNVTYSLIGRNVIMSVYVCVGAQVTEHLISTTGNKKRFRNVSSWRRNSKLCWSEKLLAYSLKNAFISKIAVSIMMMTDDDDNDDVTVVGWHAGQ